MSIVFLNIFYSMYLAYYYPFESRLANRIELFGEIMNMYIGYCFFVFSDFVKDYDTRYNWAFTNIACVSFLIFTNMVIILIGQINTCIYNYHMRQRSK